MTNEQMSRIDELRRRGIGYTKIADILGMKPNTVKAYCTRHSQIDDGCLFCGKPLQQTPGHRQKKFCSHSCRTAWWNKNRFEQECGKQHKHTCPFCGQEFLGYGNRTYCSVHCRAMARRQQDE